MQYKSVEHAYQAIKAQMNNREDLVKRILDAKHPRDAKRISKEIQTDQHWELIKFNLMAKLIRFKAEQCSEYRHALLTSGDSIIVEAVEREYVWSCGLPSKYLVNMPAAAWPGENRMGKLHCILRDELRDTSVSVSNRTDEATRNFATPSTSSAPTDTATIAHQMDENVQTQQLDPTTSSSAVTTDSISSQNTSTSVHSLKRKLPFSNSEDECSSTKKTYCITPPIHLVNRRILSMNKVSKKQ